jgi:hypothetical protein
MLTPAVDPRRGAECRCPEGWDRALGFRFAVHVRPIPRPQRDSSGAALPRGPHAISRHRRFPDDEERQGRQARVGSLCGGSVLRGRETIVRSRS